MKNIIYKSTPIILLVTIYSGCTNNITEINVIEPNVSEITKIADEALQNSKIQINDVNSYLTSKFPIMMNKFKDYDLRFDYKNKTTTVLICKDDKALYEDHSCNSKIDFDYTKENLECNFYVEYPKCD